MALLYNFTQRPHDVSLCLEVHRQIGVFPVAQYAQANKALALNIYLSQSVVSAGFTKFGMRYFLTSFAFLLFYVVLNGQPMTVPAGYIGRIETIQGLGLHDEVFKRLIDRVT